MCVLECMCITGALGCQKIETGSPESGPCGSSARAARTSNTESSLHPPSSSYPKLKDTIPIY